MKVNLPFPLRKLERFGSIVVSGQDARAFLQGQLSLDMDVLGPDRMELASCNSAQGRVQAVLWLIQRGHDLVLLLPHELVEPIIARLRKYVLRAKVKIESGLGRLTVCGATQDSGLDAARAHRQAEDCSVIRWPGAQPRTLVLAPTAVEAVADTAFEGEWRLADIRAALPQVYLPTHETFVAQMLNIDALGGIGFEKGCYTGQEIIARAHFRGTVKRRMFRFAANGPAPSPGARIVSGETHAGDVVDAAASSDGSELLAVISLSELQGDLRLADSGTSLRQLPLPYEVTTAPG